MNLEHAINAAARAIVPTWDVLPESARDLARAAVRPVVEAAAPHLVSSALRDAAEDMGYEASLRPTERAAAMHDVSYWLCARADQIQAVTR